MINEYDLKRRVFLRSSASAVGFAALHALLPSAASGRDPSNLHHLAKAKRIIYLFQSGGPSQLDLFDPKPNLEDHHGKPLPDSVRNGKRITTMTSKQKELLVWKSPFAFKSHGESGIEFSELLPNLASHADELCVIRSVHTDAINHDPAITLFQTGFQLAGRPSIGSWVSYGLGAINQNLPCYVALTSQGGSGSQPLYSRLWGAGFLPSNHSGVKFRNTASPVFYLKNPGGISQDMRRDTLDDIRLLNQQNGTRFGNPSISERIAEYELAFKMQTSIPELVDLSKEPQHILDAYGPDVRRPGSFARNCLLARRLAQRDVRFIQLFHMGWDHHSRIKDNLPKLTTSIDKPFAALINDLKQTGLLDDTLVVFGGEFGRTVYAQEQGDKAGRDHHPYCFSTVLAGAGIKGGMTLGKTDDFGYNTVEDPVHVHDLNATILHLLGIDHEQLTYEYQGRRHRLTDVHGKVLHNLSG